MESSLSYKRRYCFSAWPETKIKKAHHFAEGYKKFLSAAKTERLVVDWVGESARQKDFHQIDFRPKQIGVKTFLINRHKAIVLAVKSRQPLTKGIRIIACHVDSPRIDLKALPLYEAEKMAFFKTHYYGGLKTYQWTSLPLALYGVVVKKNNQSLKIALGDQLQDPVFLFTDLLPHLAKDQWEKKLIDAIKGEELNLLVGAREEKKFKGKDKVKQKVLALLQEKYGLTEEDLFSADLSLVPVGPARDAGFDRSLISGYGHDDRSCTYAALQALFASQNPPQTNVLILLDREEIGSEGVTGATSSFIKDFLASLLASENPHASENDLRDLLANSHAISADVTAAFDPTYKEPYDPQTAVRLGAGLAVEKHTGGLMKAMVSEASAEYTGWIRHLFNRQKITWQPAAGIGTVDLRGGGTVSMFFARQNIEVIDAGIPVLSMHAPFEIIHKGDLYAAFEAYRAFFQSA